MRIWPLALFNLLVLPAAVLRTAATKLDVPVRSDFSIVERFAFFTWPTHVLQSVLLYPPLETAVGFVYGSWFAIPVLCAIPIILFQPERYWRFLALLAVTYWACVPFYALFPLQPPWLHDSNVFHVTSQIFPWATGQDPNPYAPMPSLHIALPAAAAIWFGWRSSWGRLVWCYLAAMSFTVIYTGDHYVADIAAGVAIAWLVFAAMRRLGVIEARPERTRVEAQLAEAELQIAA